MLGYFIFNNVSSADYLIINALPTVYKPERDIKLIEVPGRDGFLTEDLGSYRGVTKSVECTIKDLSQIDYICSWLTGSGDVVFSNEPTKKYKAVIINQIEFKRVFVNYRSFIILFECQPHKYGLSDDMLSLSVPGVVLSLSNTISMPKITVYGAGDIDLTINSNIVHLTNVVTSVTIDSELMDCYKGTTLKNSDMSGEFPVLISGVNNISWAGTVTEIEILPHWRWL